jgi:hypothetical protein
MPYDPEKQVNFKLLHHFLACVMGGGRLVDNITYNSSHSLLTAGTFMIMLPLLW